MKLILLCASVVFFITACKKNTLLLDIVSEEITGRKPTPPPPPPPVPGVCDYNINENDITAAGWIKTFDDNFSTDLSQWNIWYGGAFNNELEMYQSSNLSVTNGSLVITAKKETVSGPTNPFDPTLKTFNYTSGRIESIINFSASESTPQVRIMARIKLPAGYGLWPAFWSYGDPWPTQGEIDILEARGQEDNKYQTNYFYGRAANRNQVRGAEGYVTTDVSLQSCFHVYEVIWSQNELKYYFDGVLVKSISGDLVPNIYGKKERIVLNLAVGGNFFSNFNPSLIQTGSMNIDWVKVFVPGP